MTTELMALQVVAIAALVVGHFLGTVQNRVNRER